MKVLFVTNGLGYGGAERIVEALAEDCVTEGDEVRVVATTRGGPIADALEASGVVVDVLHIQSALDVRVASKLGAIIDAFSPDVIHSHLAVADIATALANQRRGVPLVTTVHNPGVELGGLKTWLWHRALRRFDRILCVGERVRDALPEHARVRAQVVRASLIAGAPEITREAARARIGVSPTSRLVMAAGRLTPVKGFDVLARAADRLPTDTRIVLIGDGPDRDALADRRLELLGARDDAADLLAAADVVVCPSRSEGFPQVPLHAFFHARPVVATPVGGMTELVLDGITGAIVPVDDAESLAIEIERLLDDPARGQRLGAAGRDRIFALGLTREEMARKTRAAYRF